MAYFQITWTQTDSANPFGRTSGNVVRTVKSGAFSSPFALKSDVIPYPPATYSLSYTTDRVGNATLTPGWSSVPIPTPYEVNPVYYTWSLNDSTTPLVLGTGSSTGLSGNVYIPGVSYYFMVYTFQTAAYATDYFYILANSTGGGGTSSNSSSELLQYLPPIMPTPSITFFSTFLQNSVYTINLTFTFADPPSPATEVSTLFTIGLYSNSSASGTYIPCSTLGYYQQRQSPTNSYPSYAFNLTYDLNSGSSQTLNFTVLSGYYYTVALVASDMQGNVADSLISPQSPYQFYNPIVQAPSSSSFDIFQSYQFSNVQIVAPYVQNPTVSLVNISYNWILYSSPDDTTYISTTNTGNFPAFPGGQTTTIQTLILPTPILGNAYYKLYVNASAALNVAQPSYYFSSLTGIYAPPSIPAVTINLFQMASLTTFNLTFSATALPMPNTGWGYAFYSNTSATGEYKNTGHSGIFPLTSATNPVSTPTFSPAVTSGTRPNYTFTITSGPIGGGTPFTDNTYYKVLMQGIGSNGTRFVNSIIFPPCLIGASTVSGYSYIPAGG